MGNLLKWRPSPRLLDLDRLPYGGMYVDMRTAFLYKRKGYSHNYLEQTCAKEEHFGVAEDPLDEG